MPWWNPATWRRKRKPAKRTPDYDAAGQGRRFGGWQPRRAGPQSWARDHKTLVARSRDAYRNNPHARRAITTLTSSLVGPGLTPQFESRSSARNVRLTEEFRGWAKPATCDRAGRLSFGALQRVAETTRSVSGSCFVRRWWVPGQRVPLALEVLEPDMLDTSRHSSNPRIEYGIEMDDRGRPVAYHLFETHPGESSWVSRVGKGSGTVRVPASDIIHYYDPSDRPGALSGVPRLAPVLARLYQLDEYDVATLTRQQISATLVGTIKRAAGESAVDATLSGPQVGMPSSGLPTDAAGNPVETLENGAWMILNPGDEADLSDPPVPVDGDWKKGQLEAVAVGCGSTYMLLTGDLSNANYSSMRAGLLEYRAGIEAERETITVPILLDRIAEWWVEAAYMGGLTSERETRVAWAARAWQSVDPSKDIRADLDALDGGLAGQMDLLQRAGYDPDQWIRDQVEWRKKLQAAGLPLPPGLVPPAASENSTEDTVDSEDEEE